jgi:putative endonuclease
VNSVYIIFSEKLNKYYVGESENVDVRIRQHNNGYFESSFTSTSYDWSLFLTIDCKSRIQARKIESHIKKMKSRKYIENLKVYSEMVSKLKEKYRN